MNARGLRRYVDDLLRGRRPKPFAPDDFEAAQIRTAIELRATRQDGDAPRHYARFAFCKRPEVLDEFAACGIERAEDIRDLFIPSFYFGCEADDPTNAWAFNTRVNPFGARLRAIFSSDISHWDAPVMADTVAEAYELVERELFTKEDFREFMFVNPVRLYAGMNPDFFKGAKCEAEVARLLQEETVADSKGQA